MKNLVGYLIIGIIYLMGYISLASAQRVGRGIGKLLWLRRTRAREVARVNLSLCYPELSAEKRDILVKNTLIQNGMIGAEVGPLWGYSQEKILGLIRKVHNEHLFDEALRQGKGILFMAPHIGNWEILGTYTASKCNITTMYRPAKIKSFNDWMVRRREAVGTKLVPTTGKGVRSLFDILKQGKVVGFLPDQEPKHNRGVFAPFMGVETLTPTLPHQLIQETNCIVIYAFAERLPDAQGFDVHLSLPSEAHYDADPIVTATAMNAAIEACVQMCPDQYQWTYKRFKRRPEGEKNPYSVANVP